MKKERGWVMPTRPVLIYSCLHLPPPMLSVFTHCFTCACLAPPKGWSHPGALCCAGLGLLGGSTAKQNSAL